ncbi:MAG: LptA/OstA family protein [Elsteraceae bacterium]
MIRVALALLFVGVCSGELRAQAPAFDRGGGPIEIEASDGIEWRRDEKVYIASGNAKAVRGTITLNAARLIARYRDRAEGARPSDAGGDLGGSVYRLEAEGKVVISTPTQTAYADKAVYDVDQSVIVLTGKDLRIEADSDIIMARDSLEWYESRRMAVARGDAVVVRGDRRVDADVLTAFVEDDPAKPGQTRVRRVEAFGKVRIATVSQTARGDRGVYDLKSDVATLAGLVKLTQGDSQLNGDYGEMNMTTGVARLLPSPDGKTRVQGLIVPQDRNRPTAPARSAP